MASTTADGTDGSHENPYILSLQKNMRNINKKLTGMHKTDAVIKENPGVSLDDLLSQKKINADQKASALKKPQLQAQLAALEEQVQQYKKFDAEYQAQIKKLRDDLTSGHGLELEKIKAAAEREAVARGEAELKKKLLVFSQFLRAAAAKRVVEEDAESNESKAFEGALLLVYGGDDKAVDTAVKLIEGAEDQVPSIEGSPLPVKYCQIKQASLDHAPYQSEETWVDSVAEANASAAPTTNGTAATTQEGTDPTIAHAGLTELNPPTTNGLAETHDLTSPNQGGTGDEGANKSGNTWDTTTSGAEKEGGLDDSFEMIPRPNEEVDTPAPAPAAEPQSTSWADDAAGFEGPSGNQAGESWDTKAPGQEAGTSTNGADDGFHEVPGRHRGRGGQRGGRGDGEFRGRGGRGGGRGRGGYRGGRGDGEFRGRGRGRGAPRGDGGMAPRS